MKMQELLGFLFVCEALWVVQAQSGWRKEEEKRKSSQGKFFPLSSAL